MSYPLVPAAPARSRRPGLVLAQGAAVATVGAIAVGVFSGITDIQSAKVAILAGWLVGLTIHRGGRDVPAATGAAALSLAGAAIASVIGVSIRIVKAGHVPFGIVAAHMTRVLTLVPHVIGWFGLLCWALAALVAWSTVRGRGRQISAARRARVIATPAGTPGGEPDGAAGSVRPG